MRVKIQVNRDKYTGRYRCRIRDTKERKNIRVGTYETEKEAYKAGRRYLARIGDVIEVEMGNTCTG